MKRRNSAKNGHMSLNENDTENETEPTVTGNLTDRAGSLESTIGEQPVPATFAVLIESVKDYAIFMLDARGMVATWNAGAKRIKGYEPHEIIGQYFAKFYPPEVAASGKCEMELEVAARDGRFEDEGWRVRKDGSRFWANVIITALRDEHDHLVGFAKVTRDLTERRKAEDERIEYAKLQEASNIKDQFLATISHELRTPLNAILGWASLLKTSEDLQEIAKGLETIERNGEAQAVIIDDMLDMSRIVTGKMRIDPRAVDLAAIVRDAIEVVRPAADAREIRLYPTGVEEPIRLVGDPVRLQQVAWNFLSNAVKFCGKGGSVSIALTREDSSVLLRVADTGQGIAAEFLPYVFEPFRQAESGPARRVGGVGLGLAIVKHIVALHGGVVSAESAGPGQGASFTAKLPVRAVAPVEPEIPKATPAKPGPAPGQSALRLDGIRVLAIDDEADAREILKTLFRMRGATAYLAGSAEEGRQALASFKPHIIVSDVGMPGEDGYQFMRSVRALPKENGGVTPAIALTAYAYAVDRQRALDAGFNYHFAKPVDYADLIRAMHNLVSVVDTPWRRGAE
ncbi:ATP-binding protein [Pendulispora albinea]|uniref:histidine kinase n=1 Tax=Pendulispora albinea TaxID=2741071 RepID=A0ABZ2LU80_9BACT